MMRRAHIAVEVTRPPTTPPGPTPTDLARDVENVSDAELGQPLNLEVNKVQENKVKK